MIRDARLSPFDQAPRIAGIAGPERGKDSGTDYKVSGATCDTIITLVNLFTRGGTVFR